MLGRNGRVPPTSSRRSSSSLDSLEHCYKQFMDFKTTMYRTLLHGSGARESLLLLTDGQMQENKKIR